MPPAIDRAPRRRRPRQRPSPAARPRPSSQNAQAYVSQGRAVAHVAHQQRHTQGAAVRASHFIPGLAQASQPKPLQSRPPRHPVGARKPGFSTPHRREVEQVARGMLHAAPKPKPKRENALGRILHALSPGDVFRTVYGGQAKGPANRGGAIATASGGTGLLSPPSTFLPARVMKNVGIVVAEDPKKQIPKLLKDTGESVVSIPAGVVRSATDPKAAVKNIASDYSRRYGSLLKGDETAFRKRLQKEGVAPEVFDIAGLSAAGGSVTGRVLQKAAESGALGEAATRIATVRPELRVSGGAVKTQPVSDNFFRNVIRAGVDQAPLVSRRAFQARRASRPEASALVREAEAAGQVTKIRPARTQRRAVAQVKGRQLTSMKVEQQAEVGGATRAIGSLSKPEQQAFKYAMQYGVTTPETARRILPAHKVRVEVTREAHEAQTGLKIPPRQNELPTVDYLIANADKAFTPKLAEVVRQERKRAVMSAVGDPGVDLEQAELRRTAPQRELFQTLGVMPRAGETRPEFLARLGLKEPGYFPSEKRAEGVFSAHAVGGRQAVKGPQPYTGALTRTGRENTGLDVFPRGIARNIKRKYNWNLVADNFDRHAFSWSKNKTIAQLKDEMERRGIDQRSVEFWNPRVFRDHQHEAARIEGPDVEAGHVTSEAADVHSAAQLATNPAAFKGTSGWSLVPKAVHDEIMTDIRPSGIGGRGLDILKGKASRILLGNPAWLQFQVASNAFLTGLSGTGPVDAVKAQVWWRKLPEEQKRAIEPYIGVHRWYDDQTHLGAAANNHFVNAYRALKETGLYKALHKANPLDALFRADNAQNNFFRKAVFYNKAKRETYRRMGHEAGRMMALQERAARILTLPPSRMMDAVVKDADTFERLAEHTNKFLGDYMTYTATERKKLGRVVMFYGFLRYSLKFTLYTMPIEHPIVSSMLAQVGRLERDEQKRIFGADVPAWELGNLYTKSGRKYQLSRLSPFFNATQYGEPGSLVSSMSPLVQTALNQAATKNLAFDKPFTVEGSGKYVEKGSEIGHPLTALVPGTIRSRIAAEELLRLSPFYRLAEKTGVPGIAKPLRGKQTSESGLLFPDPVRYKMTTKQSREAAARNAQSAREQAAGGAPRQLQEQLLPLLGQQGQDTIRKSREFDAAQKEKKRKGPRRRRGGSSGGVPGFDTGSGGGVPGFSTGTGGGVTGFG